MEEKDKWIKNLRTRMEDYSEPAPADLWDQLEKELDTPKVLPVWRRWQAVAAVALLVVASSLTVWFWQSPSAHYMEQHSAKLNTLCQPEEQASSPVMPEPPMTQAVPATPSLTKTQHTKVAQTAALEAISTDQNVMGRAVAEEKQIEENYPEEQKEEETVVKDTKQRPAARSSYPGKRNNYTAYAVPRKKQDRGWSIGLSTGNGTFSSSTQMDGYLPLPRSAKGAFMGSTYGVQARADIDKVIQFANLAEGEAGKSDIKYRMPVTVGASLRFDLDNKWAIETGVMYTQLSSETSSGAKQNNYSWEDKLHYVGIPLKISRDIWSNERFEVYASAGGAVEKCVSGKQKIVWNTTSKVVNETTEPTETDIKVKPLQWSLSAAAGAQFKITEKLGIYAEPGVVYYFDDGSNVNTIRKEHPFNFNIQLGVRFTLPK